MSERVVKPDEVWVPLLPEHQRPKPEAGPDLSEPAANVEEDGTPHHKTIVPGGAERCLTCDSNWPCQRANELGAGDPTFGISVHQNPEPFAPSQVADLQAAIRSELTSMFPPGRSEVEGTWPPSDGPR